MSDYRYSAQKPQRKRLRPAYGELSEWHNFYTPTETSNHELFMSRGNIARVLSRINQLRLEYSFNEKPPIWPEMLRWAGQIDINRCSTAYEYDTATLLSMLNERFIVENPHLYCRNLNDDINVFRQRAVVLDGGALTQKSFADLLPEDIRNMNLWRPINIGISNEQQRYNNKFPTWQMNNNKNFDIDDHRRMHYERDELTQVPHGPNMDRIYELNTYKRSR